MTDIILWLRYTASTMGLPHKEKLNKAADDIEYLESCIERLQMALREEKQMNQRLRDSYEEYVAREQEMRHCLKLFVKRDYHGSISWEEAINKARRVLEGR